MERAPRRSGRRPREAASPSALAPALLRYVAQRGIDPTLLAERAALDADSADKDEIPITAQALAGMLAFAAELLADPHLALRLPAELTFRRWDAGALAARVAATPRDALLAIGRFSALVFPRLETELIERDGELRFCARIGGAPGDAIGEHHVHEYVVAFALAHCRRGGTPLVPRRVWLATPRPAGDLAPLFRALGTEDLELGAEDTGFALAHADAKKALPAFDPMLAAAAEQLASEALALAPRPALGLASATSAKIEALLRSAPQGAAITADAIASGMKMSARTLQRRLEDEGVRFAVLLDEVRERVAKNLLGDPSLSLAEVAFRVGFSDLATFSRAFKRWTGIPPGAFRREPR